MEGVEAAIRQQLSKLGSTIFELASLKVEFEKPWFLPASTVNEWRRVAVETLERKREEQYVREERIQSRQPQYPETTLSYLGNVTNKQARLFYKNHGVEKVMPGFEIIAEKGVALMFMKHCVKYEMGW